MVRSSDNYLTLDTPRYSFDGVNYSKPIRYMGIFDELLKKRHNGDVYLLYTFEVQNVPSKIYFLSEDMHNRSCKVNGKEVEFSGHSDFEKKIYKADIASLIKKGENQIVLRINFYESEQVYYALFGENVTEGVKNCLAYDTTIEACYLSGDFGVYSKSGFSDGGEKNWLYANDFYISDKKPIIVDLVKDGYPFFAGDITLEKTFTINGKESVLELDGNFCLSEIVLNGKKVEKSYFASRVDVSDYLVEGENVATITLWSGNQNLLGPHHLLSGIRGAVSPVSFELFGTWKDGKSSYERDDYLFVRFGLFND